MERSDWDDDEYPSAPVPRHERPWRHPSEMGAVHWERTEPPLVLGRGLLAATGVIGTLLAVGVLWVMLPAGPDDGVTVDTRTRVDTTARTTGPDPRPTFSTPTTLATTTTAALPTTTEPSPVPTMALRQDVRPAVAVPVASGSLIVTTARAVADDVEQLDVELADGTMTSADVVLVDRRSGLAVLTLRDANGQQAFTMAATPQAGERLTILADVPRTVVMPGDVTTDSSTSSTAGTSSLRSDASRRLAPSTTVATATSTSSTVPATTAPTTSTSVSSSTSSAPSTTVSTSSTASPTSTMPSTTALVSTAPSTTTVAASRSAVVFGVVEGVDPDEIPEGTPVVNEDGHLVGVCSHADDGSNTLLLVRLDALLQATGQGIAHGWLGIALDDDGDALTITAVDPDGPAAAAGLSVGDRIVAFDGRSLTAVADLLAAMADTEPGDRVMVTIAGTLGGPPQRTVTVTLSARPDRL